MAPALCEPGMAVHTRTPKREKPGDEKFKGSRFSMQCHFPKPAFSLRICQQLLTLVPWFRWFMFPFLISSFLLLVCVFSGKPLLWIATEASVSQFQASPHLIRETSFGRLSSEPGLATLDFTSFLLHYILVEDGLEAENLFSPPHQPPASHHLFTSSHVYWSNLLHTPR